MGTVQVHQARGQLTAHEVLTSVDVLGAEPIADKTVTQSWELLGQMPGIQLTETRQGAESGKVSFRAFNGEGYLNAIKTLIDGIPSNVNSGNQRFIDMIFPLDLDYIEVVRGTNDPRYGLHNIGGNINFVTRQGGNYTDGRLTYGSFVRIADLTTATSAHALVGLPRELLSDPRIDLAVPAGRQLWPASDRAPVAVQPQEFPSETEGLRCVLHWVAHRSMMLVARRSARTPCAAQMVLSHSCHHVPL